MQQEVMPAQRVVKASTKIALLIGGLVLAAMAIGIGELVLFDAVFDMRPAPAAIGCEVDRSCKEIAPHVAATTTSSLSVTGNSISSYPMDGTVTVDSSFDHIRDVMADPQRYCPRCTKFVGCRVGWWECVYREGDTTYKWMIEYEDAGGAVLDWTELVQLHVR